MSQPKGKEREEKMVATLRQWQGLERQALETTAQVMEQTNNAVIRQVMEIIRNDSLQHHRVQQFIIDSLTKESVSLTPEEMGEVWSQIEAHDRVEKKTIELAKELRDQCPFPVAKTLLEYLIVDEEKHEALLSHLNDIKRGMYP